MLVFPLRYWYAFYLRPLGAALPGGTKGLLAQSHACPNVPRTYGAGVMYLALYLMLYYMLPRATWWCWVLPSVVAHCPLHPCGTPLLSTFVRVPSQRRLEAIYDYGGLWCWLQGDQGYHVMHYARPDLPWHLLAYYHDRKPNSAHHQALPYSVFIQEFLEHDEIRVD
jgi:fatty acid desaturase